LIIGNGLYGQGLAPKEKRKTMKRHIQRIVVEKTLTPKQALFNLNFDAGFFPDFVAELIPAVRPARCHRRAMPTCRTAGSSATRVFHHSQ
jgi:hypothetical protein